MRKRKRKRKRREGNACASANARARDNDDVMGNLSVPVLIVPGWTDSGPGHWQTLWERAHRGWRRVEQDDWHHPDRSSWIQRLDEAVAAQPQPPLLVAHSLGAVVVAIWAAASDRTVRAAGALLVAPADVEAADAPEELVTFAPIPRCRLPFPTIVAASRDDPYLAFARAEELAAAWGATLHDCGLAGHLNTAAGYGPWPVGEALFLRLQENARGDRKSSTAGRATPPLPAPRAGNARFPHGASDF
jgi:uncharacterized protein